MGSNFLKNITIIMFLYIILTQIISFVICPGSKAIYSDPVLDQTSHKFDGFIIDFKGILTPYATYWSLCNFQVDLTDFKKTYPNAEGGGAYGGLQVTIGKRVAILSFWEIHYKENNEEKILRANRVYPDGAESNFGGEGEGTNYIAPYEWKTSEWYRWYLKSWQDERTGNTFVGEWIQELDSGKWTLFTYFNTNVKNSYLTGGMSFFQENFIEDYGGEERSFQLKNTYVHDIEKNKWISLPKTYLSFDPLSWHYNSAGTHEEGATDEYFWGSAGLPVDNQEEYDNSHPPKYYTINQPDQPSIINGIKITNYKVKVNKKRAIISWDISEFHSPMISYMIKIMNNNGNTIHSYKCSRPDERVYVYTDDLSSGTYSFKIEVTSIFDEKDSKEISVTVS